MSLSSREFYSVNQCLRTFTLRTLINIVLLLVLIDIFVYCQERLHSPETDDFADSFGEMPDSMRILQNSASHCDDFPTTREIYCVTVWTLVPRLPGIRRAWPTIVYRAFLAPGTPLL